MAKSRVTYHTTSGVAIVLTSIVLYIVQGQTFNTTSPQAACACDSSLSAGQPVYDSFFRSPYLNSRVMGKPFGLLTEADKQVRVDPELPVFRYAVVGASADQWHVKQRFSTMYFITVMLMSNSGYNFPFEIQYDLYEASTPEQYAKLALDIYSSNNYSAVIGPEKPERTTTYENMFSILGMPNMGYYATDPSLTSAAAGRTNYLRVNPSEKDFVIGSVQAIQSSGWKKAIFLTVGDSTGLTVALNFETIAEQHNIAVSQVILLEDASDENIRLGLRKIKADSTRVVVTLFADSYLDLLQAADEMNMLTNEYVWIHSAYAHEGLLGFTAISRNVSDKLAGWLDGSLAAQGATAYGSYGATRLQSIIDYANSIQQQATLNAQNYPAPAIYYHDALLTLLLSAQKLVTKNVNLMNKKAFVAEMKNITFQGITGHVSFSPLGARNDPNLRLSNYISGIGASPVAVLNRTAGQYIFSKSIQYRNGSLITPADSTPPDYEYISPALVKLFFIIASLVILIYVAMLVFIFKFKNTTIIYQSGFEYLFLMICGSIVMVSSVYVLGVDMQFVSHETRDSLCMLSMWQIGLGYLLVFGSLFSKSLRILLIILRPELRNVRVFDRTIYSFFSICILIEVVILIAWTISDPVDAVAKYRDNDRTVYYVCESNNVGFPVGWICYNMIFLLTGVVIAFLTRNVERRFNESKIIGFSIYNVFLISVIIIPMTFIINNNSNISFVLQCIGVIGIPLGSTVILFGKSIMVLMLHLSTSEQSEMSQNKSDSSK